MWKERLVGGLLVMGLAAGIALGGEEMGVLPVSKDHRPLLQIALDSERATAAEKNAAQELIVLLERITGATFELVEAKALDANAPAIMVGDTEFARAHGIEPSKYGPEEAIVRTVGRRLVLAGGRPRGTLYAVYDLLGNVLGCRWYTPWYDVIPSKPDLTLPTLDRQIAPAFIYRYSHTQLLEPRNYADHLSMLRFYVRNRMNMETPPEWGDGVRGGRSSSHSFMALVPTEKYFKDHPEYFSERKGKREPSTPVNDNQLCLTNPDVLKLVIEEVKKDFRDYPTAFYDSVSFNDCGTNTTMCDCPKCRAVAKEEGESGLVLQFVNAVADAIKDEYPGRYILTLAYNPTGEPPKRIRARDNVIIYLCRGGRTSLCWFPKGDDAAEFGAMKAWARFAKHVWMWDYSDGFYGHEGLNFFRPMTWQMYDQFQSWRRLGNVDGVFQENEFLGLEDVMFTQFYEMNLWLFGRLCQQPNQPLDPLIDDFLTGYYGKAAPALRRYVDLLKTRRTLYPFWMFDFDFTRKAQDCFDKAEAAAKQDPLTLAHVEDLRINLDMATVAWRNDIVRDYLARGGKMEEYPFPLATMRRRLMERINASTHPLLRCNTPIYHETASGEKISFGPVMDRLLPYVATLCSGRECAPLPEAYKHLPADRLIDLTGATFGWDSSAGPEEVYGPEVVADPEAALGLATKMPGDKELPAIIGIHSNVSKGPLDFGYSVRREEVPGPGYHWYKGPRFVPDEGTLVYVTNGWRFQVLLWTLYDPKKPRQAWDVYVSMKFTGPAYPYGKPNEPNAVWYDRMILAPVVDQ